LAADYHRHALSHVVKVKNAQQLILLLFSHFLQTKIDSQYKVKKSTRCNFLPETC
jgi:hypothetical protein